MNILESKTLHTHQRVDNGISDPVIIWATNETHWYDFKTISSDETLLDMYTLDYQGNYKKYFKQNKNENNSDYLNRLYVYSDSFEKTYQKFVLRSGKYSQSHFIPEANLKTLNGQKNKVYCEEYNSILLCDLQEMVNHQNKSKDYFLVVDDTLEILKSVFDIEDGETGSSYLRRLKYYYFDLSNAVWLYKQNLYVEPEYDLIKEKNNRITFSETNMINQDDGESVLNVVINGSVNPVLISDNEVHHYDFDSIYQKKFYSVLKNNYWKFYSRIFNKKDYERMDDYTRRLESYFLSFENQYKKYLKSLKTV